MTMSVWHDKGLQRTNPVHVIDQVARDLEQRFVWDWNGAARDMVRAAEALKEEGAALPSFKIEELKRRRLLPADFQPAPVGDRPGVLGLVTVPGTDLGYVLALEAHESPTARWDIDETLPFRPEAVLDALVQLARVSGLPTAGILPERLAFSFDNPLRYPALGNSMTIAAVLAILDALDGHRSEVLRCASTVVEPGAGGCLKAVDHIRPKLAAVRREYEQGSLLICAPGCPEAAAYRPYFGKVWEVADFAALARELHEAGLLTPLMRRAPLRRAEWRRLHDHLKWLIQTAHNYAWASDLGERLAGCEAAEPISASLEDTIEGLIAEAWRHQGRFIEANTASRRIHERVLSRGHFTSYGECTDAAAEYAAALFEAHCFRDILPLLLPWVHELSSDPQRLRGETRAKVLNTLGRARVVLGEDGWESLFRRSLEIQERLNPGDMARTRCYLIHGLLRHGRLDEAREELAAAEPLPGVEEISGRMLRFLRADLERRTQGRWIDGEMEALTVGQVRPGHPAAFYFQATARQPGQQDAASRLRQAAAFLRDDGQNHPQNITSLFAHFLGLYAAVAEHDPSAWLRAAEAVRRFLDDPEATTLRAYYAPALARLTDEPEREVVEHFLSQVPYF